MVPARRSSRAPEAFGAGERARPLGGKRLDWGAAFLPLRLAVLDLRHALAANGHVQRAIADGLTGDAVFLDQGIDHGRSVAEFGEQAVAGGRAERGDEIVGLHPHAGIDQADIAAGAAEADHPGFDDRCLDPFFGEVKSRREAGEAAADDGDIGRQVTAERLGFWRGRCRRMPEVGQGTLRRHRGNPSSAAGCRPCRSRFSR